MKKLKIFENFDYILKDIEDTKTKLQNMVKGAYLDNDNIETIKLGILDLMMQVNNMKGDDKYEAYKEKLNDLLMYLDDVLKQYKDDVEHLSNMSNHHELSTEEIERYSKYFDTDNTGNSGNEFDNDFDDSSIPTTTPSNFDYYKEYPSNELEFCVVEDETGMCDSGYAVIIQPKGYYKTYDGVDGDFTMSNMREIDIKNGEIEFEIEEGYYESTSKIKSEQQWVDILKKAGFNYEPNIKNIFN